MFQKLLSNLINALSWLLLSISLKFMQGFLQALVKVLQLFKSSHNRVNSSTQLEYTPAMNFDNHICNGIRILLQNKQIKFNHDQMHNYVHNLLRQEFYQYFLGFKI